MVRCTVFFSFNYRLHSILARVPEQRWGERGSGGGPKRYVLERSLGTQIGLRWSRQNERYLVMVKDPPIDFEEVVVCP
jgi:hypothetical protein